MSDSFKVQDSLKDADGDMVNFRADSNEELEHLMRTFPYAAHAEAKAALRGAAAAAPIVQPAGQPQQQVQQRQPQQQNPYGGTPHPESKSCHCGKVLELKKTSTGKSKWQCPDWRWNNGNPNNHAMEWAN